MKWISFEDFREGWKVAKEMYKLRKEISREQKLLIEDYRQLIKLMGGDPDVNK